MVDNKTIVEKIIKGIQELKGEKISVVDMTDLESRACDYFVICQAQSSIQVGAITRSIKETVNEALKVKPYSIDGLDNSEWVVMDYGQIFAHIFQPEPRAFYDIDHLWSDAKIAQIPD
jgi:ribosome-associated protein